MQSEITVQTLYNEKNKQGRERGVKDIEFSVVGEIGYGFSRGLIKNNVQISGCDQEKIMGNFQGS